MSLVLLVDVEWINENMTSEPVRCKWVVIIKALLQLLHRAFALFKRNIIHLWDDVRCIFLYILLLYDQWLLIMPRRNMRSSVYDLHDDVSEKQFPEFSKVSSLPPSLLLSFFES